MTTTVYNRYFKRPMKVSGFYDGGTKAIYTEGLEVLGDHLLKRSRGGKRQNVVEITGPTGSGKSTKGINLALAMDPEWDIAENYIYDMKDLKRILKERAKGRILLFDEASVSLNSNNSQRKEDKMTVVIFDTLRSFGNTWILCIPADKELNSRIRNYHVDYQIKCPVKAPVRGKDPRGYAKIFEHRYRDFGLPYYQLMATTETRDIPEAVKRVYEPIKLEHQLRIIDKYVEEDEDE